MADVRVSALLTDVAELFEPMFEDARQKLVLVLPEHDAPIRAHELLLRQAVGNLLHNAASHAGEGAVITLSQVPAGNGVDIIVADTGPGIPEGDRGRVQQRFVKLELGPVDARFGLGSRYCRGLRQAARRLAGLGRQRARIASHFAIAPAGINVRVQRFARRFLRLSNFALKSLRRPLAQRHSQLIDGRHFDRLRNLPVGVTR